MRTDIITDRRQVICKNASVIGYSTRKVRVGDFVMWDENGQRQVGRMLARMTWNGIEGKCKYIVVARLANDCTFVGGERWVKPDDVMEAYPQGYYVGKVKAAMRLFLGDEMRKRAKRDITDVRAMVSEMWGSWEKYDGWKQERKSAIAELEGRK